MMLVHSVSGWESIHSRVECVAWIVAGSSVFVSDIIISALWPKESVYWILLPVVMRVCSIYMAVAKLIIL